jgi:hypothetical protein
VRKDNDVTTDWPTLSEQKASAKTAQAQAHLPVKRSTPSADFWAANEQSLPPVLTTALKEWLVSEETVFPVVAVSLRQDGQYGPTWWATVVIEGTEYGAPFRDNETRTPLYKAMQYHVVNTGPLLASMRRFETIMGVGYDLCPPYGPVETTQGSVENTDDLPF